jgi:hypothetical protein
MARKGNGGFVPFTGNGHKLSESPDEIHMVTEAEHDAEVNRILDLMPIDQTLQTLCIWGTCTPDWSTPGIPWPEPKPERSQPEPIQADDVDIFTQGQRMFFDDPQLEQLVIMKTFAAYWLPRVPDDRPHAASYRHAIQEHINELTIAISYITSSSMYACCTSSSTIFPYASMEAFMTKAKSFSRFFVRQVAAPVNPPDSDEEPDCYPSPAKRRKDDDKPQE